MYKLPEVNGEQIGLGEAAKRMLTWLKGMQNCRLCVCIRYMITR